MQGEGLVESFFSSSECLQGAKRQAGQPPELSLSSEPGLT